MYQIFGQDPEAWTPSLSEYHKFIQIDDLELFYSATHMAVGQGEGSDLEIRIVRPDGELRHIALTTKVRQGQCGRSCRAVWDGTGHYRAKARCREIADAVPGGRAESRL